jgi:purine-binding chemotaxis protein CheW
VTDPATPKHRMFCTFRLNGRLFGVDVLDAKEVTAETAYTPVAHAPDEVLGLVNIRGHIYLALDLHRLLGLPVAPVSGDSRLVLFKPTVGNAFGVMVDAIADIRTVDAARTGTFALSGRDANLSTAGRAGLIDCVCQLDGELLVVLNPRRFLAVIEQASSADT